LEEKGRNHDGEYNLCRGPLLHGLSVPPRTVCASRYPPGEEDKKSIADIVTEYIILYRRHMAAIQEDTSIPEDQKNTWSSLLAKRLEEIEGINN
jgi:hypothetical protein